MNSLIKVGEYVINYRYIFCISEGMNNNVAGVWVRFTNTEDKLFFSADDADDLLSKLDL